MIVLAALSAAAQAQSPGIAPEAKQILKASTDFLASQQRFSTSTRNTLEVVLKSGQKIEFNSTGRQSVQRPDKLRAERTGDIASQLVVYDGKSVVMSNPQDNVYSRVAAPETLEDMLEFARKKLDIVAPDGDLIYWNAYDILMDGVTDGIVIGKAVIEGVRCDHLAFRAPQTDWQIWIQEGSQPLPRKLVITTLDLPKSPQLRHQLKSFRRRDRRDTSKPKSHARYRARDIDGRWILRRGPGGRSRCRCGRAGTEYA